MLAEAAEAKVRREAAGGGSGSTTPARMRGNSPGKNVKRRFAQDGV